MNHQKSGYEGRKLSDSRTLCMEEIKSCHSQVQCVCVCELDMTAHNTCCTCLWSVMLMLRS